MEEQKRRKEQVKLKQRAEDEADERKLLAQQQEINKREAGELQAEGRKAPDTKGGKAQVDNSQFEPSAENKGVFGDIQKNAPKVVVAAEPTGDFKPLTAVQKAKAHMAAA